MGLFKSQSTLTDTCYKHYHISLYDITREIVIELSMVYYFICRTVEPAFDPEVCGHWVPANLGMVVMWLLG